ncbi:hypothetical protein E2C01_065050 [Portunus trituberculatus]|uniref:Uncharacterized protein n=1 Tax=Portunus trituberculatus TaxID=210409 RepID=A0A5B7HDG1_PORTR|nr:hypothetical protein [Portunus trituberculatus]
MLAGGCASTFSHQGLVRELWTVGASPCYLLTAEGRQEGGEMKAGWEFGPLSSQVIPGPYLCKVPQRRYCAGSPSVGGSGRPPMSPGGGHWSGKDLRQRGSSGSSRFPCGVTGHCMML